MAFDDKRNILVGEETCSPLATKLQQAWLQSQLPKVQNNNTFPMSINIEIGSQYKTNGDSLTSCNSPLSHLPEKGALSNLCSYSTKDSNFNNHGLFMSEAFTGVGDFSYHEESTSSMISFLDDILMEEDIDDKPFMYDECSAYKVMEKGFADLINEDSMPNVTKHTTIENGGLGQLMECNNIQRDESLDFIQLSEEIFEDHLVHKYTDTLCQHVAKLELHVESKNNYDINTTVSKNAYLMHNVNSHATSNILQEHINTSLGIHFPYGTDKIFKNNVKFSLEANDDDQLTNLLTMCAEAIGRKDVNKASHMILELRKLSSPYGNGVQRMAHYVVDALVARLSGTGTQLYTTLHNTLSAGTLLRAYKAIMEYTPYCTFAHVFCNVKILDAFKGATRVHLVDYGILYGLHWPSLIQQLAMRQGGPPHLRITGIDRPQPGSKPSERVEETGRRLSKFAKKWKLPFKYTAIVGKWEDITPIDLDLEEGEVLAINCVFRLRHLPDISTVARNPRLMFLNKIRTMNPKVFVIGVVNARNNEPFFMSRVRETIKYYSTQFDTLDDTMPRDLKERIDFERAVYGRSILNVIACEGRERVERPESYKQWHNQIEHSGFKQLPLQSSSWYTSIESILKCYNNFFDIEQDGGWLLTGWKKQKMYGFSAWEPNRAKGKCL